MKTYYHVPYVRNGLLLFLFLGFMYFVSAITNRFYPAMFFLMLMLGVIISIRLYIETEFIVEKLSKKKLNR